MKVGDLIIKKKGARHTRRVGVITRVYNKNNGGKKILEVLSNGLILQWHESWCEYLGVAKNESR